MKLNFAASPSPLSRRQCLAALAALPVIGGTALAAESDGNGVLDLWQRVRAQLLLNPRLAYFDTATLAPALRAVLAAQYRALDALHSDPQAFYAGRYTAAVVQELLGKLAQWLDCDVDEVCGARSGDSALTWVADMLPLAAGDEIVIASQLPDTLLQYWQQQAQRLGCRLATVHLPMPIASREQVLETFTQAVTERTRVLCFSHVQSLDGTILPVKELCAWARERGVTTLVEGSLALGALPVALHDLGCDAYAGSLCHWLQGAAPSAALYVRREVQARWTAPPPDTVLMSGVTSAEWPSLQRRWPADFLALAAQFQALPAALQWHTALGGTVIENRLRQLQTYLRINLQNWSGAQVLTSNQPGMQLQLLSLRGEGRTALQTAEWLQHNDNVIVGVANTAQERTPVLRIALNVSNTLDEVDRLVQGLRRALRT